MDYAVRAFHPESRRNVAFVPVAVNYEHVIEDKNLQVMKARGKRATRTGSWRSTAAFSVRGQGAGRVSEGDYIRQ